MNLNGLLEKIRSTHSQGHCRCYTKVFNQRTPSMSGAPNEVLKLDRKMWKNFFIQIWQLSATITIMLGARWFDSILTPN